MKRRLIERRSKIDIRLLRRMGQIPAGANLIQITTIYSDGSAHRTKIPLSWRGTTLVGRGGSIATGQRAYFRCRGCQRRCEALFPNGCDFQCRKCLGLAYASENRSSWQRTNDRIMRLHAKLASQPGCLLAGPPTKPKWMRWTTYNRIVERLEAAEDAHVWQVIAG